MVSLVGHAATTGSPLAAGFWVIWQHSAGTKSDVGSVGGARWGDRGDLRALSGETGREVINGFVKH